MNSAPTFASPTPIYRINSAEVIYQSLLARDASPMANYHIRFFFDPGCTPFWSADDATRQRFGYPIAPEALPLSADSIGKAYELAAWHDRSLNAAYPPDPGPWRQAECDRFNAAVREYVELVRRELGAEFEVRNEQPELCEDPELDKYLQNPHDFKREERRPRS